MFEFIKKLMPKEEKFFDMFEAHAAKGLEAAKVLRQILDGGPSVAQNCNQLMKLEDEADHIGHDVGLAIHRSFITPFDRSDISALIAAMDDAVDQMNKTAKAVMLFELDHFEPAMRDMADMCVKMAAMTCEAVPLLRNINPNAVKLRDLTARIVRMEEESDQLNDAGMKALIKGKGKTDAMAYIVGAEIYDHLEKVADRFEDVANVINGIVIEHV